VRLQLLLLLLLLLMVVMVAVKAVLVMQSTAALILNAAISWLASQPLFVG
jgi:hypothetical protein